MAGPRHVPGIGGHFRGNELADRIAAGYQVHVYPGAADHTFTIVFFYSVG